MSNPPFSPSPVRPREEDEVGHFIASIASSSCFLRLLVERAFVRAADLIERERKERGDRLEERRKEA